MRPAPRAVRTQEVETRARPHQGPQEFPGEEVAQCWDTGLGWVGAALSLYL